MSSTMHRANATKYEVYLTYEQFARMQAVDKEWIGSEHYMGLAYFWNYEYRFHLRDATAYQYRERPTGRFRRSGSQPKHGPHPRSRTGYSSRSRHSPRSRPQPNARWIAAEPRSSLEARRLPLGSTKRLTSGGKGDIKRLTGRVVAGHPRASAARVPHRRVPVILADVRPASEDHDAIPKTRTTGRRTVGVVGL
jgi:hypothetical protein